MNTKEEIAELSSPYESIKQRNQVLFDSHLQVGGMGPLDLVHITRHDNVHERSITSWFEIDEEAPVDNGSSASIAAFINDLVSSDQRQKKQRITQIIYCSWNPCRQVDIRVEAGIPGSCRSFAYNGHAAKPVQPLDWRQLRLSHLIRYGGDVDGLVTLAREAFEGRWDFPGDDLIRSLAFSLVPDAVATLFPGDTYLLALSWFFRDALEALKVATQVNGDPSNASKLACLAAKLLPDDEELGRHALRLAALVPSAWIHYSLVMAERHLFREALLTLNSCPSQELLSHRNNSHPLASVEEGPMSLLQAPQLLLNEHLEGAYAVLIQIVQSLGWEPFLQLRDSIFSKKENNVLCAPWLEQLIAALYQDVHAMTLLQAELELCKSHGVECKRTGREWVVIGQLARRHGQEALAKEALNKALLFPNNNSNNSKLALEELLGLYAKAGQLGHFLVAWDRLKGRMAPARLYLQDLRRRFGTDALIDAHRTLQASLPHIDVNKLAL